MHSYTLHTDLIYNTHIIIGTVYDLYTPNYSKAARFNSISLYRRTLHQQLSVCRLPFDRVKSNGKINMPIYVKLVRLNLNALVARKHLTNANTKVLQTMQ